MAIFIFGCMLVGVPAVCAAFVAQGTRLRELQSDLDRLTERVKMIENIETVTCFSWDGEAKVETDTLGGRARAGARGHVL